METKPTETAGLITDAMRVAERSKTWTAGKAGLALSTFDRKLRGGGDFTVGEVARIARALQVHPSSLLPPEFADGITAVAA